MGQAQTASWAHQHLKFPSAVCPHLYPPAPNTSLRIKELCPTRTLDLRAIAAERTGAWGECCHLQGQLKSTLVPGSNCVCWGCSMATGPSRLLLNSFTFLGFNTKAIPSPTGSAGKPTSQRQPPANHPPQPFSPGALEDPPSPPLCLCREAGWIAQLHLVSVVTASGLKA